MAVAIAEREDVAPFGRLELAVLGLGYPVGLPCRCNNDDRGLAKRLAVAGVLIAGVIVVGDLGLPDVVVVMMMVRLEHDRFMMRATGQRDVALKHPAERDEQRQQECRRTTPPRDGQ